jgi:hypothetical protein
MKRKTSKFIKLICTFSFVPVSTLFVINAANAKTDIVTIFGNTVNMSCVIEPTNDDVITYLSNIGTQMGYSNIGNQLVVGSKINNNIPISCNPKSREFTGTTTVIYTLPDEPVNLEDAVNQENIN